jgi:hypothetical protein
LLFDVPYLAKPNDAPAVHGALALSAVKHMPDAMDTTFAKKATAKVSKSRRLQAAERGKQAS